MGSRSGSVYNWESSKNGNIFIWKIRENSENSQRLGGYCPKFFKRKSEVDSQRFRKILEIRKHF